jgi:hypothetical protein
MKPNRAPLILTFGILGLVCCLLFGVAAWVMGSSDLHEMDAGRMDPSGRDLTKTGRLLGIIGVVLQALVLAFYMVFVVLAAVTSGF